jgi:uncharacterized protein with GYD domain
MPQYVMLMNLTAKGLQDLKDAPKRIAEGVRALEASGGKILSFHCTMGPYDYVAIADGPEEVAAVTAMSLGSQGYVTTQTMRAFTREEFAKLVSMLP